VLLRRFAILCCRCHSVAAVSLSWAAGWPKNWHTFAKVNCIKMCILNRVYACIFNFNLFHFMFLLFRRALYKVADGLLILLYYYYYCDCR